MTDKNNLNSVESMVTNLTGKLGTTTESLEGLRKSIDQIEKMLLGVREITTKTDLLALNASIEAARAGHSGKGFAVVAHEVARLAEKSQESIEGVDAIFAGVRDGFSSLSQIFDHCSKTLDNIHTEIKNQGKGHIVEKQPERKKVA